jgi:hypothetical protein
MPTKRRPEPVQIEDHVNGVARRLMDRGEFRPATPEVPASRLHLATVHTQAPIEFHGYAAAS